MTEASHRRDFSRHRGSSILFKTPKRSRAMNCLQNQNELRFALHQKQHPSSRCEMSISVGWKKTHRRNHPSMQTSPAFAAKNPSIHKNMYNISISRNTPRRYASAVKRNISSSTNFICFIHMWPALQWPLLLIIVNSQKKTPPLADCE